MAHRHFVRSVNKAHFSQKERKGYPLFRIALASMMKIPDETLSDLPLISMTGQHRLLIENYTSVRVYEPERIAILCKKTSIYIEGKRLKIIHMNQDEILIDGYIASILYK